MEKNIVIILLLIALLGQNFLLVKRIDLVLGSVYAHLNLHEIEDSLDNLKRKSLSEGLDSGALVLTEEDGLDNSEVKEFKK
jgi:hypothetical protein